MPSKLAEAYMDIRVGLKIFQHELRQAEGIFKGSMGRMSSVAGGILAAAGVTSMIRSIRDLGVAFVSSNADMEQYRLTLGVLLKDESRAARVMTEIEQMAAKTPFSTEGLVKAVMLMKTYGFEMDEILPKLKRIGDAAAASPVGMEFAVHRISLALGQMRTAGKLLGQDVRQLTEVGIPVNEILRNAFHRDFKQLQEDVKAGVVKMSDVIEEILKGMDARFGGLMEKASKGFRGLMSTAKDLGTILMRRIGEPLFAMAKVKLMNIVAWAQSPAADEFVKKMIPGMEKFAATISKLADDLINFRGPIAAFLKIGAGIAVITGLVAVIGTAIKVLALLRLAMIALNLTMLTIAANPIMLLVGALATALGVLAAAWAAAALSGESFNDVLVAMKHAIFGVSEAEKQLQAIVADEEEAHKRFKAFEDQKNENRDQEEKAAADKDKAARRERMSPEEKKIEEIRDASEAARREATAGIIEDIKEYEKTIAEMDAAQAKRRERAAEIERGPAEGEGKKNHEEELEHIKKQIESEKFRRRQVQEEIDRLQKKAGEVGDEASVQGAKTAIQEQKDRDNNMLRDAIFGKEGKKGREGGIMGRAADAAGGMLAGVMEGAKKGIAAGGKAAKGPAKAFLEALDASKAGRLAGEFGLTKGELMKAREEAMKNQKKEAFLDLMEGMGFDRATIEGQLKEKAEEKKGKASEFFGMAEMSKKIQSGLFPDDVKKHEAAMANGIKDLNAKVDGGLVIKEIKKMPAVAAVAAP